MNKPKENAKDCPPEIHVKGLPKEEWQAASQIRMLLFEIASRSRAFEAALALFDRSITEIAIGTTRSKAPPWANDWLYIAARDGAMTIYHFGKALENISNNFAGCPTVLSLVDRASLTKARQRMKKSFPRFEAIRHSVAHAAELMKDDISRKKHSILGPIEIAPGVVLPAGIGVSISGTLNGRVFLNTFEGKLQSYEISKKTLDALAEVRAAIYMAFLPLEADTLARKHRNEAGFPDRKRPT